MWDLHGVTGGADRETTPERKSKGVIEMVWVRGASNNSQKATLKGCCWAVSGFKCKVESCSVGWAILRIVKGKNSWPQAIFCSTPLPCCADASPCAHAPPSMQVIIATNRGEPLVLQKKLSLSGIAYENSARRLVGKQDYFIDLSNPHKGMLQRFSEMFN